MGLQEVLSWLKPPPPCHNSTKVSLPCGDDSPLSAPGSAQSLHTRQGSFLNMTLSCHVQLAPGDKLTKSLPLSPLFFTKTKIYLELLRRTKVLEEKAQRCQSRPKWDVLKMGCSKFSIFLAPCISWAKINPKKQNKKNPHNPQRLQHFHNTNFS